MTSWFFRQCFHYIRNMFHGMSYEEAKAGIFDWSQIRRLLRNEQITTSVNKKEHAAWESFKTSIQGFLGNIKDMLGPFEKLSCHTTVKPHFLNSHVDRFPGNLGDLSD